MSSATAHSPSDAALLAAQDNSADIQSAAGMLLALSRKFNKIHLVAVDRGANGVLVEKLTAAAKALGARGIEQRFVQTGGFETANFESRRLVGSVGHLYAETFVLATAHVVKDAQYLAYLKDCLVGHSANVESEILSGTSR